MFRAAMTPPAIDQATVDFYIAKGRRERSIALREMFRSIFRAPKTIRNAEAGCAA